MTIKKHISQDLCLHFNTYHTPSRYIWTQIWPQTANTSRWQRTSQTAGRRTFLPGGTRQVSVFCHRHGQTWFDHIIYKNDSCFLNLVVGKSNKARIFLLTNMRICPKMTMVHCFRRFYASVVLRKHICSNVFF